MTSTRSTLIIKSGADFSCLLSADSPTPIHIHALLTQPLSGKCHTLDTLIAKSRGGGCTHEPSASTENDNNNVRRHIFAADITAIAADPADSTDGPGGTASQAAAAAIPSQACLKYATGAEEVAALRREGVLYSRELAPLADVAVPRTYGFFTGGTGAVPIACLVMDLCVSTEPLRSANEFCRLAVLAVCKVHAVRVMHNTLLNLRHFVMKGKKVFLVDFAVAMVHQCGNAHPVLVDQAFKPAVVTEHNQPECGELIIAERNIFSQIGEQLPRKIAPPCGLTAIAL